MEYLTSTAGLAGLATVGAFLLLRGGPSPVNPASFKQPDKATLSKYSADQKPYSTTVPDGELPIRLGAKGVAATPPTTVFQNFATVARRKSDTVALRVERDGKWQSWTWKEYYDQSLQAGKAFMKLGLAPFESVCIIGFNSPEWLMANVGAIAAGGMAAGIYTTNEPTACKFIAEHSGARVAVVEDDKQLQKFLQIREQLPKLVAIVVYAPGSVTQAALDAANAGNPRAKVYNWAQFMALGDAVDDNELRARLDAQRPSHVCTLIYTSGTTGDPKAVMITHDNLNFTCASLFEALPGQFGMDEEHLVSYLPLSHIAAQMTDIHLPIFGAANLAGHVTVHFARPDALKGTLGETLKAVRPTLFFGVPRVWEKIEEKMRAIGATTTGVKKTLATWAKACGAAAYEAEQAHGSFELPFGFSLAKALVLDRVRAALGLDRCKLCLTGAAPIQHGTLKYFGSLYLPIYELFGQSENTGPQTLSVPGANKLGSTGRALPGTEMKIDHDPSRDKPGEGEICFRGRHIMAGYLHNEKKTREAIDNDGWLHSGDVGRVDSDGFLYITGRIKELIITAGGENIAPVPMEDAVKAAVPGISNVCMIGDKRKYNVALVTLKTKEDGHGGHTSQLTGAAASVGAASTVAEAKKEPAWRAYIQKAIDKANEAAVSRASKIQKFAILDDDFSVNTGCLTATLKLKRPVVAEKYADVIEELYK